MGCLVTMGSHDTVVMRRRDTPLRGVDVDMADVSDLVPTLAVVADSGGHTDADHRCGFHPRQGGAIAGRSCQRAQSDRCARHRRAGRLVDRTHRPSPRGSAVHPPRPSSRDGLRPARPRRRRHRGGRPRSGVEELAGSPGMRSVRSPRTAVNETDPAASSRIVRVAAFDVDGTLTQRAPASFRSSVRWPALGNSPNSRCGKAATSPGRQRVVTVTP